MAVVAPQKVLQKAKLEYQFKPVGRGAAVQPGGSSASSAVAKAPTPAQPTTVKRGSDTMYSDDFEAETQLD